MYDLENTVEVDNLKDLLKFTTEYDIYSFYIGNQFSVGKVMKSPLRKDDHPSFGVFKATISGNLLYKDQATGKTGNVVHFVSEMFNLSLSEALKKIIDDTLSGKISTSEEGTRIQESYKRSKTTISIQRKNFTEVDDEFWGKYSITRDILKKHNVCPIHTFWVNDTISNIFYTKEQPLYAYGVFDKYQIYNPYGKRRNKFRTNCNIYDMYGLEQLPQYGNLLIITKSNKDVIVLDRLGYNAVAPTGENTPIPEEIMQNLKDRFKRIVILYDNDSAGKTGAQKLAIEHDLNYVYIDSRYHAMYEIKDISDWIKVFNVTSARKLLKELLNEKG